MSWRHVAGLILVELIASGSGAPSEGRSAPNPPSNAVPDEVLRCLETARLWRGELSIIDAPAASIRASRTTFPLRDTHSDSTSYMLVEPTSCRLVVLDISRPVTFTLKTAQFLSSSPVAKPTRQERRALLAYAAFDPFDAKRRQHAASAFIYDRADRRTAPARWRQAGDLALFNVRSYGGPKRWYPGPPTAQDTAWRSTAPSMFEIATAGHMRHPRRIDPRPISRALASGHGDGQHESSSTQALPTPQHTLTTKQEPDSPEALGALVRFEPWSYDDSSDPGPSLGLALRDRARNSFAFAAVVPNGPRRPQAEVARNHLWILASCEDVEAECLTVVSLVDGSSATAALTIPGPAHPDQMSATFESSSLRLEPKPDASQRFGVRRAHLADVLLALGFRAQDR